MMDPSVGEGSKVYENGLFSLAIADTGPRQHGTATATRSNVMEMTKFVSSVLFLKTKMTPQARHALSFRRCVARWSSEIEALSTELATLTNEDMSAPSFRSGAQSASCVTSPRKGCCTRLIFRRGKRRRTIIVCSVLRNQANPSNGSFTFLSINRCGLNFHRMAPLHF
jgi:hypothetical protein